MKLILHYNIHWGIPLRVTSVFQFVRIYVRINSLNALIMLWSSTSRPLRELTIHDKLYPI